MFQMVGSIRGSPSGFGAGGNGNPPPPPPPPGIEEVLAAQTEILRQLVQAQQQQRGGHHAHQAQELSYQYFLSMQPPKADEPLDADAWIRTIESSFLCCLFLVPKQTRLDMPRSNFADQLVCGGIITTECYWLIMWLIRMSSRMLFGLIIFWLAFLIGNSMSSWH